jgi:lipopolysaccharide exporter
MLSKFREKLWKYTLENTDQIYSLGASLTRSLNRLLLVYVASKFLSKSNFGILSLFLAVYFFSRMFSDGCLQISFLKYGSTEIEKSANVNFHIILLKILYVTIVSLLIFLFSHPISSFIGINNLLLTKIVPLLIAFGFYSYCVQCLNAKIKMREVLIIELVQLSILLLLLFNLGTNVTQVETYIKIMILSFSFSGIFAVLLNWQSLRFKWKFDKGLCLKLFDYSKYSVVLGMGSLIFQKTDIIMLGHLSTAEQVGTYGVALIFIETINAIISAISNVSLPTASLFHSQSRNDKIMSLYKNSIHNIYILSVPYIVAIIIFYPYLVKILYHGKYNDSITVVIILSIGSLFKPFGYIAGSIITGMGYVRIDNKNNWITAVVNVILNLTFIPIWGVVGAAMATGVSLIVFSFLQYKSYLRCLITI